MTNLDLGRMAFGCWRLTEPSSTSPQRRLNTALDAGLKLIDTADIYGFGDTEQGIHIEGGDSGGFGGAEAVLGQEISRDPSLRGRMILATKGGIRPPLPYNSRRDYLTSALDASLKRLRTDYIDIYQIHRPDLLTGFEALAETLDGFITSGKVRALGVSNFTPPQIRALSAHLKNSLLTHQPEVSLWANEPFEDGTLDICQELSLTPLAWSPLNRGRIVGMADNKDMQRVQAALKSCAAKYDASPSQIALAFLLAHPAAIIPIIGTQRPERILESAAALNIKLEAKDWYALYTARLGQPLP